MTLNYVTRAQWNARPPDNPPIEINMPTGYLYVHHSAGPVNQTVRSIQDFHMDTRGFNDIAYNYLVGGEGQVYEGRGWGIKGGHVLDPENALCHGICLLGNFNNYAPSHAQIVALTELIAHGKSRGWWEIDVRGHRDTMDTSCPGNTLYHLLPSIEKAAREFNATPAPKPPVTPKEDIIMKDAINFYVRKESTGAVLFVMRNLTDPNRPFSCMGVDAGSWDSLPEGAVKWGVSDGDFSFFLKQRIDT